MKPIEKSIVAGILLGITAMFAIAANPIKDLLLQSNMDAGGHQITNLAEPTNSTSAATLGTITNAIGSASTNYATAGQGATADSAVQPGDIIPIADGGTGTTNGISTNAQTAIDSKVSTAGGNSGATTVNTGSGTSTVQSIYDGGATDDRIFYDDFSRADTADNNIGLSQNGLGWIINGSGAANARLLNGMITSNLATGGAIYFYPDIDWVPRQWGFTLRMLGIGGGGSWSWATGMTLVPNSVSGGMIHIVGTSSSIAIEMWPDGVIMTGGMVQIASEQFNPGLAVDTNYGFRVEVDPANDRVSLYSATGLVVTGTHPNVSDFATSSVFVEIASSGTSARAARYDQVWAENGSSPKATAQAAVAAAKAQTAMAFSTTAISVAGAIESTGGSLSVSSNINSTHNLGKARTGSISDQAYWGHRDQANINAASVVQTTTGYTEINGTPQADVKIGNVAKLSVSATAVAMMGTFDAANTISVIDNGFISEGATADGNEGTFTFPDWSSDKAISFPDKSGTVYVGGVVNSGTATLNVSTLATLTTHEQLVPVTGAVSTGTPAISVGFSGTLPNGLLLGGSRVVASGTVGVSLYNSTGSDITDTSTVIRATVFQP